MSDRRHSIIVASLIILCAAAGCMHRGQESPPPNAVSKGSRLDVDPGQEPLPSSLPVQDVTNESQLALDAAADAEARGDIEMALELYDWASMAEFDPDQQGEIAYRMARLRSDPGSRWYDPGSSRETLSSLVASSPSHPRAPEARVFLALLDRVENNKAVTTGLESDLVEARTRLASMKEELEKKDQELKSIKNVLLRKQP